MPIEGTSPVIYRNPRAFSPGASYLTIKLGELIWVPAATETYHHLTDAGRLKPVDRKMPDRVRIAPKGSGALREVEPERLNEYVRNPTARHRARIEAAEQAIVRARVEYALALKAAFRYGRPISLATVKLVTRERKNAQKSTT